MESSASKISRVWWFVTQAQGNTRAGLNPLRGRWSRGQARIYVPERLARACKDSPCPQKGCGYSACHEGACHEQNLGNSYDEYKVWSVEAAVEAMRIHGPSKGMFEFNALKFRCMDLFLQARTGYAQYLRSATRLQAELAPLQ